MMQPEAREEPPLKAMVDGLQQNTGRQEDEEREEQASHSEKNYRIASKLLTAQNLGRKSRPSLNPW